MEMIEETHLIIRDEDILGGIPVSTFLTMDGNLRFQQNLLSI